MEISDVIKSRRTVRKFKEKPIDNEILFNIFEAGRWAPAAGNLSTVRFLILEDEAQKKIVAKAALNQKWLLTAPALALVCSLTEDVVKEFPKRGKMYALQNTSLAAENVLLAAEDQGISSAFTSVFTEVAMRKAFQIPDNIEIHAIIALGYADEEPRTPSKADLYKLIYFGTWGETQRGEASIYPLNKQIPKIQKKTVKTAKKLLDKLKPKRKITRRKKK